MKHDDALPALPIGEAEVLWHEPDPVMPERPGKIIDASHAFMDAAPLGTRLYSAEQMRAYVRADRAARAAPARCPRPCNGRPDDWPAADCIAAGECGCGAAPPAMPQDAARAEPVWAADGWRQECDDADAVLRLIGLDPERCRTEGGWLNVPKIRTMLRDRALVYLCPAGCGCTWRDNGDGSMSLYGPSSRSCAVCETMPLSKLLPLFAAPPALREAARLALEALENCSSEHGHRCNRCDSEVDEGGTIADALRSALAAEQPQPKVQPAVGVQACRPEDRAMLSTPAGAELLTKVAMALTVPQAVATAPKRIWLQVSDDRADMDEPFPGDGATWCADSVVDAEVEYVRADLAPPPSAPCPHIRSSGVGDHATHWCALNGPPAVPEPSEAEVEAAWRAIPASHEDSRVSVITKGDVWVMLRAAAAARKA